MSTPKRFFKKIEKTGTCWFWSGSRNEFGYGQFGFRGKVMKAHRVSWILHLGIEPDGLGVLHRCDNPACVNPDHLFLGTHSDNMKDRHLKGRGVYPLMEKHRP